MFARREELMNTGQKTVTVQKVAEMLSLKNLINDFYAKDISRKIKSSLETKQKNGEFIGSRSPYGYQKSPEDRHKLIPDPEVVPIVREIFERRSNGEGYTFIARTLNERGVPNPTLWHYRNGYGKSEPTGHTVLWNDVTVRKITRDPVYLGHLVQKKWETSMNQRTPAVRVSRENQIVVENTHEAIITQELFDRVNLYGEQCKQEYMAKQNPDAVVEENCFRGFMICKDCGAKMARRIYKIKNGRGFAYEYIGAVISQAIVIENGLNDALGGFAVTVGVYGFCHAVVSSFIRQQGLGFGCTIQSSRLVCRSHSHRCRW